MNVNSPSVSRMSGHVSSFVSGRSVALMRPKMSATTRNGPMLPV